MASFFRLTGEDSDRPSPSPRTPRQTQPSLSTAQSLTSERSGDRAPGPPQGRALEGALGPGLPAPGVGQHQRVPGSVRPFDDHDFQAVEGRLDQVNPHRGPPLDTVVRGRTAARGMSMTRPVHRRRAADAFASTLLQKFESTRHSEGFLRFHRTLRARRQAGRAPVALRRLAVACAAHVVRNVGAVAAPVMTRSSPPKFIVVNLNHELSFGAAFRGRRGKPSCPLDGRLAGQAWCGRAGQVMTWRGPPRLGLSRHGVAQRGRRG